MKINWDSEGLSNVETIEDIGSDLVQVKRNGLKETTFFNAACFDNKRERLIDLEL
jgi:hypothetical protein